MDEHRIHNLRRIADTMAAQNGSGPWSTHERSAAALINNRIDWLPSRYDNDVMMALMCMGRETREEMVEAALRNFNGR